jgi:pseudaminic acid cytidylyltransferase
MAIALIPARSGSKRIPDKNIKLFGGHPIMWYPIRAALDSKLFSRVIVSTDTPEYAEVAKGCGAEVPWYRNLETAGDTAALEDVLAEAMERERGDEWCMILATALFVTPAVLFDTYSAFRRQPDLTALVTAVPYEHPVQRAFTRSIEGKVWPLFWDGLRRRSQELEPTYHDAAQLYWVRRSFLESWRKRRTDILLQFPAMYVLPRAIDIDTPEDWARAEAAHA